MNFGYHPSPILYYNNNDKLYVNYYKDLAVHLVLLLLLNSLKVCVIFGYFFIQHTIDSIQIQSDILTKLIYLCDILPNSLLLVDTFIRYLLIKNIYSYYDMIPLYEEVIINSFA